MTAFNYQLLIKNILKMPLAQVTHKQIIYRGEKRFTYPQFAARVSQLANVLTTLGAKRGTRVGVMDWDSNRYLEAYFAVPMMGATLMMVNIRLSPEQIAYTIDHAEVEILLVNKDFLPVLDGIRGKLPHLKKIVLLTDDGLKTEGAFVGEYEELLGAASDKFEFPDFDENTIATTFYTTGTTGNPKGVYFSHRQLVLHTLTLMSTMMMAGLNGRISREDVYMPLTPMFHVHAWGFPYVATMMGMQQVYTGRFLPPVVLKLLATEKVTVSHCVPTIMHMILSAPEAANIDLRGWKVIIGGSAMPRAMCTAALQRGIDIFTGYGMSETCPILTISHLKGDLINNPGTGSEAEIDVRVAAGLPGVLIELDIVDENMKSQPRDGHTVGEVVARGPALTAGYIKNQEASDTLWQGGWLHTGDIGTFDANGYLHVLDRSKDVIKTGGEWISSIGLEDVILSHHAISECAVIGVEDSRWGERPIAVVVLKPDAHATEDDIKNLVRARAETGELSKFAIPDHVVFAQSLEKTSVGKLDKKKMRAMYGTVKAA
ncbi:MAG: long-chain fatty acid--CoA ligase [Acidocella sp. 20-57-95]|nr:MAG: long-chain fatty acid--CoA ligase [Acidocella sp. 20-57-95]OYV59357.1 MAG: long-chain fatty acid--CoA ligase [Acidocella sp. 21-58-7]HQT64955.1 fatty acid--CoA ligase [Acidocella sp.]HQU04998.1 fatty acid--CoA ligase [Acidocella sp.]